MTERALAFEQEVMEDQQRDGRERWRENSHWGPGSFLVTSVLSSVWTVTVKTLNLMNLALPQGEILEPAG